MSNNQACHQKTLSEPYWGCTYTMIFIINQIAIKVLDRRFHWLVLQHPSIKSPQFYG
ncbi:MAG: hypothetical protein V7K67_19585 [Nostoc sp.]|uniref:hypothetical protein n=1 Tax=Nostoc sp. TaxID=1180 RepID=UPI002FF4A988